MPPRDLNEFYESFSKNHKVEGFGVGNLYVHHPCPFCAAPDFWVYEVLSVVDVCGQEATCVVCGRTAKTIFDRDGFSSSFRIVQTNGDDPPSWLPRLQRVK